MTYFNAGEAMTTNERRERRADAERIRQALEEGGHGGRAAFDRVLDLYGVLTGRPVEPETVARLHPSENTDRPIKVTTLGVYDSILRSKVPDLVDKYRPVGLYFPRPHTGNKKRDREKRKRKRNQKQEQKQTAEEWLGTTEVAELWDVNPKTVRESLLAFHRLGDDCPVRIRKTGGSGGYGRWRIHPEDARSLVEQYATEPEPDPALEPEPAEPEPAADHIRLPELEHRIGRLEDMATEMCERARTQYMTGREIMQESEKLSALIRAIKGDTK